MATVHGGAGTRDSGRRTRTARSGPSRGAGRRRPSGASSGAGRRSRLARATGRGFRPLRAGVRTAARTRAAGARPARFARRPRGDGPAFVAGSLGAWPWDRARDSPAPEFAPASRARHGAAPLLERPRTARSHSRNRIAPRTRREWIAPPSTGSLPSRRLAAIIGARGARSSAMRRIRGTPPRNGCSARTPS